MNNNNITLATYFNIIWKNKFKIFWVSFVVGIISIIISLFLPKWYKSTAVVLSPNNSTTGLAGMASLQSLGIGNLLGSEDGSLFKYMAILKSRTLREGLIKKYNLIEEYESENMQLALLELDDNMVIEIGDEYQLNISIIDKNQDRVNEMTNYIVNSLDSINKKLTIQKAKNDRLDIEKRYHGLIDSLDRVSLDLKNYMKNNNLLNLEGQVTAGVQIAMELQSRISAIETEINIMKKTMNTDNKLLLNKTIELEGLKKEYDNLINNNNKYIPAFQKVPELGVEVKKYENTINYLTRVIEFIAPQYEKYKMDEIKITPSVQVLDWARRPDKKHKPKRSLIVIVSTFIAGFTASMVYIIKES